MNILITSDSKYLKQIEVLLKSIELNNPGKHNVYLMHRESEKMKLENVNEEVFNIKYVVVDDKYLDEYPQLEKRYPVEIYYKLIAHLHLPKEIDRILYLDPDIVVKGNISEFYNYDFKNNYYVATSHVKKVFKRFNDIRLGLEKEIPYINVGVMLINLEALRKIDVKKEIDEFLEQNRYKMMLPDQDIISCLYGNKTIILDDIIYNLGERNFRRKKLCDKNVDADFVEQNVKIIHYYGRNKPWNKNYRGILNKYYNEYESKIGERL